MMYFIESVSTPASTGKSRKAAALQAVVKPFEHTILVDFVALSAFVHQLHILVDAVNTRYKGKTVYLRHSTDSGHIYAHNVDTESNIFSISYTPVGEDLRPYNIRNNIYDALYNFDREIWATYSMDAYKEGGEL